MGKTIIISSHILPELADFCNKVGIIERGEMLVSGDVQDIMDQVTGGRTLEVRLLDKLDEATAILTDAPGVRAVRSVNSHLAVDFTGSPEEQAGLNTLLISHGLRVLAFTEQAMDLEDIFMKVTQGLVQ
jgi:ABC-2 type transport system ATP-binding protein